MQEYQSDKIVPNTNELQSDTAKVQSDVIQLKNDAIKLQTEATQVKPVFKIRYGCITCSISRKEAASACKKQAAGLFEGFKVLQSNSTAILLPCNYRGNSISGADSN